MRKAGLRSRRRRRFRVTTHSRHTWPVAADQLRRDFKASAPNRKWAADITYIPTWAGFLYLAVVLDAWSRKIVGWALHTSLREVLVHDAFEQAVASRRPHTVVHHSDQGSQYTSIAFGQRCREWGVSPSMGSAGDCYDNAVADGLAGSALDQA